MISVKEIKDVVSVTAEKYGAERVLLFGSYARGEAAHESDIDLRLDKGSIRGLLQLSGFRIALEDRLNHPVDVLTTESLDKDFLSRIQGEEILLYEHK